MCRHPDTPCKCTSFGRALTLKQIHEFRSAEERDIANNRLSYYVMETGIVPPNDNKLISMCYEEAKSSKRCILKLNNEAAISKEERDNMRKSLIKEMTEFQATVIYNKHYFPRERSKDDNYIDLLKFAAVSRAESIHKSETQENAVKKMFDIDVVSTNEDDLMFAVTMASVNGWWDKLVKCIQNKAITMKLLRLSLRTDKIIPKKSLKLIHDKMIEIIIREGQLVKMTNMDKHPES